MPFQAYLCLQGDSMNQKSHWPSGYCPGKEININRSFPSTMTDAGCITGHERPEGRLQRWKSRKASWKRDSYVRGWVKERKERRRLRLRKGQQELRQQGTEAGDSGAWAGLVTSTAGPGLLLWLRGHSWVCAFCISVFGTWLGSRR